jgi:hypothetical protein
MENNKYFVIDDFGAIGDGKTDNTATIQAAVDEAAKIGGTVFVPGGVYLCGKIQLKPHVTLKGDAAWSYRKDGGSILMLNDENADCMLDITGAHGVKIESLCINGNDLGNGVHGIYNNWDMNIPRDVEDTPKIDACRVSKFTGDGVHLNHIWCFSLRHCMIGFNKGNGLYINGWDGFILDNWFSYNLGAGVYSVEDGSALTFTGNRVEWNVVAGFLLHNPIGVNLANNYFDASGGPALDLNCPKGKRAINMAITGNIFHRSGMPLLRKGEEDSTSCHVYMCRCMNVTFASNTFYHGIDDCGNRSLLCPKSVLTYKKLQNCIIKDNVFMNGATHTTVTDLGEHTGEVIFKDNIGNANPAVGEFIYPFFED